MKPEPIEVAGVETVELVVRNINGEGVLFTKDGKKIGHQVANVGHYFYQGHGAERVTTFRATFIVGEMKPDIPK